MQKMPECFSSKCIVFIFVFILLSDQISKSIVVSLMRLGECSYVFSFLNIVRVENKGITFGLLSGTLHPIIFVLLSIVIIVSLFIWAKKHMSYWVPSALIISGAIGNLIDRIHRKAVVDFLDFHIDRYHWPAFNIADSSIVIGVAILFFASNKEEKL